MKKFVLISPKNRTAYNFRGDLVKEIVEMGYEVIVTGPDRTDEEKITELGARFVEIPLNKTGTSVRADLKYQKALKKLFREEKPDVTLGYTIKPVIYGAIAAKKAGVKNINSMVTGGGYTFIATSLRAKVLGIITRTLYRIGLKKADRVIFQNPDDLNEFCERGLVKREKCFTVNGSGVNLERFEPTRYPTGPSFFMLSRLLNGKGVREYLEAARAVKEKYPDTRFCLLGKYETNMQDAVPRDFVEEFVKDGTVERYDETNDVRPYYGLCGVYVLPSYREGTPRTVLEAMAMGRAVITTDTPGCRQTVVDGENGFLIPEKDSAKLAEKMIWFVEHPEAIPEMGAKSRKLVEEKFDVRLVNAEMIRIMEMAGGRKES